MSDSLNEKGVETTIVGGRPVGHGQGLGDIPHGIEVLIKKASVDASFRRVLLKNRGKAVLEIGLGLTMAEATILKAATKSQLKAIIKNTQVPDVQRPVFLGHDASAMLDVIATGCECPTCRRTRGDDLEDDPDPLTATMGIQPDIPQTRGIRPDWPTPPTPTGIRPDHPTPSSKDSSSD
jgi:hypothetical protein